MSKRGQRRRALDWTKVIWMAFAVAGIVLARVLLELLGAPPSIRIWLPIPAGIVLGIQAWKWLSAKTAFGRRLYKLQKAELDDHFAEVEEDE